MTKISILTFLFILYLEYIKAARILAVFPTPSISHQVVFRPLVNELTRRGHEVTVITADPAYPPGQTPNNLTEIDVHDLSYQLWNEELKTGVFVKTSDTIDQASIIFRSMFKITITQMEKKEVQDIIKNKKEYFDLLLLEAFVSPVLIYSHFFKVPVILVSSFGATKFNYEVIGATTHPLLYPTMFHQKQYNYTNWDKLQHLYNHWREDNNLRLIEQESDKMIKSKFGSDIPSIHELFNNVQMLFLNINPIWVDNRPVPTNVVYMGGIHVMPRKELPKDLQSFLDSSKNGVIYFSLGTNVIPSTLPLATIKMFIKVFSQLPFDVLWKWDKDVLPGQSKNIKILQWLPQSDLLRHKNVKLFITQGGLQSTDEAISAGVPLIGIPILADQCYNVQKYVHHQIGIQLDITSLTKEQFRKAIETVIGNKRYRENIIRLRTLMTDQPQSPLERAVWWTEHVLRHGGAGHLRAAGANISWAQYLELELVLIVVSTFLFILIIISILIYILGNYIRQKFKQDIKRKVT